MTLYGLRVTSAPAAEPVSLAELKAQCNILSSDTTDDDLLNALITSARTEVERWTNRAMITQTRKLTLDSFDSYVIELPGSPLVSVTSVVTYDDANTAATFSSSNYDVLVNVDPGVISLRTGQTWPSDLRPAGAIEITYVCGYGASSASVPGPLKTAVKKLAALDYRFRGDERPAGAEAEIRRRVRSYRVIPI